MDSINQIEQKIKNLKSQKQEIDNEILYLNKKLLKLKKSEKFLKIKYNKSNKELFGYYLIENKSLKSNSVDSYYEALECMRKLMEEYLDIITLDEFYFIDDIEIFSELRELFHDNSELNEINLRRHHWISAAYNNYYNFLLKLREI